jgi:hypothetical protein
MVTVRLSLAFVGAFVFVCILPHCAAVHDATPKSCPAGQEPSGGLCVCIETQAAPTDGKCAPVVQNACDLEDCVDDGNSCTEPTCLEGAETCTNEPVESFTPCDADGSTGSCVSGVCVVPTVAWELGVAFRIGGGEGEIAGPMVAAAPDGRAIAFWSQAESLMACHFDLTDGWGTPVVVDEELDPDRGFAVDMDAEGNAIVVYARVEEGSIDIRATRYDVAFGLWSAPEVISREGAISSTPGVSITPAGDVVAVWWEAPDHILLSRTRTDGLIWGAPVEVAPDDGFAKGGPYVAIVDDGEGAVIYYGDGPDAAREKVWVTPIGPAGLVGAPVEIDASAERTESARLAVSGGERMAVWEQGDDIWQAHYLNGEWEAAGLLEAKTGQAYSQGVATDGSGSFFAVWSQDAEIRARVFDANNQVWGDLEIFNTARGGGYRPSLTGASTGASFIWLEGSSIRFREYAIGLGWGTIEDLTVDLEPSPPLAHRPALVRSPAGSLVAVWPDGSDIWAWVDMQP